MITLLDIKKISNNVIISPQKLNISFTWPLRMRHPRLLLNSASIIFPSDY